MATDYAPHIWDFLMERIGNEYGVAGLMGNLYAESSLRPNNLQGTFNTSLGLSDEDYTLAVDLGVYTEEQFVNDSAGYGLAQWTYYTRKQALYDMWKISTWESIGDIDLQLTFLITELAQKYQDVFIALVNATSVREASDYVLHNFEKPANQSAAVEAKREQYGMVYYNNYAGGLANNQSIIESAIEWAVGIAHDDSHGYDQEDRWGLDYDCSSLVIQAYEQAGCLVKTNGATYTGNMEENFVESGFKSMRYTKGMTLIAGDVLLRTGHTALYIGEGMIVSAHINELGEVVGGETGDQTGHEIDVSTFSSSGNWTTVLRLPVAGTDTPDTRNFKPMSLLLMILATRR